jgi:hypothetical protein
MSDNKSESQSLELITKLMNDLARELRSLDRDDTIGAIVAAELSQLVQLKRELLQFSSSAPKSDRHRSVCAIILETFGQSAFCRFGYITPWQ